MTQTTLEKTLRSVVHRYGFAQVRQSLSEIELSCLNGELSPATEKLPGIPKSLNPGTTRSKVTASERVAKMALPPEKAAVVAELAQRFEDKSFLPTFGDIVNFCQIYGIEEPASKSRAGAIPRVFNFIATMESSDLQRILDDGLFSGPSRLGPIADAIRRNGRASRAVANTANR